MKKFKLAVLVLDLFEGGDGAGTSTGSTGAESTNAEVAAQPTKGAKNNDPYANVKFGIQDEIAVAEENSNAGVADQTAEPQSTEADRQKAYKALINGEYKDLYTKDTQNIINKRFKQFKQVEDQLTNQQALIDKLNVMYGTSSYEELVNAIDNDTIHYEQAADEAGMTVDQYKQYQALELQNKQLTRANEERIRAERNQQQVNAWLAEAEKVRKTYPDFDIENEVTDQRFQAMLRSGVPMEQAYKVMHFDELQEATKKAQEEAIIANVKAKGTRPVENGSASPSASFTTKSDVHNLTKADRAEIARRSQRGEIIRF